MPSGPQRRIGLAIDIGGTFTDFALETASGIVTAKRLTTPDAPERAVMEGAKEILAAAGMGFADLDLIIHGTTLATNALIERRGARTALVTTQGFRDSLEMGTESRFEQYDIFMEKPAPLVPRRLRMTVPERLDARGGVVLPLDEAAVAALVPRLQAEGVESLAIGFLHSYVDAAHEQRTAAILSALLPGVSICLSSDVAPEIREYQRLSTTCANAYIRPLMARYLGRLDSALKDLGACSPLLLMTSGGGLCNVAQAMRFPIRLVESGPAGGAIFAADVARRRGIAKVLSFDMGGTTAKLCLIDDGAPQLGHSFEVARVYRFLKGSGLPMRIPVIEMVEIGAGGGSIARLDALGRLAVGPASAGAVPGPACYGRGGTEPAVTDADVVLGRIDPQSFADGHVALDPSLSDAAIAARVAGPLGLSVTEAAAGIGSMVGEAMAGAARIHAIESGTTTTGRTLIAFGGAAPLHAAALADRLDVNEVLVPPQAGVGSAIGFLRAPIAYEVVRSDAQRLSVFDAARAAALLGAMATEAHGTVALAARDARRVESRAVAMRYAGQGHEIEVGVPDGPLPDASGLRALFEVAYRALYRRTVPAVDIEVMSWTVRVAAEAAAPAPVAAAPPAARAPRTAAVPRSVRSVYDAAQRAYRDTPVYWRPTLAAGTLLAGPVIIAEPETSTHVPAAFTATIEVDGAIRLIRKGRPA